MSRDSSELGSTRIRVINFDQQILQGTGVFHKGFATSLDKGVATVYTLERSLWPLLYSVVTPLSNLVYMMYTIKYYFIVYIIYSGHLADFYQLVFSTLISSSMASSTGIYMYMYHYHNSVRIVAASANVSIV